MIKKFMTQWHRHHYTRNRKNRIYSIYSISIEFIIYNIINNYIDSKVYIDEFEVIDD